MRARASIPLVLLALLLAPAAGAETARFVPSLVLDGTVPAYVAGLTAGASVTLAIGDGSATKAATAAGGVLVKLADVPAGLHEWTLSVLSQNVTTTTRGYVLVDAQVESLRAAVALQQAIDGGAIANFTKALLAMEARLEANQSRTLGNITAQLDALPLLALRNVTAVASTPPPVAPVTVVASSAQPSAWTGALPGGLLALLLLPINVVVFLQGRKSRRETLTLMLMLAAKAGITPDSPEFQKAMEVVEGGARKPKKREKAAPAAT